MSLEEGNPSRDLSLFKRDLTQSRQVQAGRPVSQAIINSLQKRWGLNNEEIATAMNELDYDAHDQTWDPRPKTVSPSNIQISPLPPTEIRAPRHEMPHASPSGKVLPKKYTDGDEGSGRHLADED